jgi:hypothetical protein
MELRARIALQVLLQQTAMVEALAGLRALVQGHAYIYVQRRSLLITRNTKRAHGRGGHRVDAVNDRGN